MNKNLLFLIFLFLALAIFRSTAHAKDLLYYFHSDNKYVKWEIGMYYIYLEDGRPKKSPVWYDNVINPKGPSNDGRDGYSVGYVSRNVWQRDVNSLVWSTACVDPVEPVFTQAQTDDYVTGLIDITDNRTSDQDEIRRLTSPYYMDYIFGTGITMCDWPPPPCNPDSCADRGITCGTYTSCGDTYVCKSGCRSCEGKQCNRTGCDPRNNGCFKANDNTCSGACIGSIKGYTWIDGSGPNGLSQEDGNWDEGEGYKDPTVQRGQINNGNFQVIESDRDRNDRYYSFDDLDASKNFDVRVIDYPEFRLKVDALKTNVPVPEHNANFPFTFKRFDIRGQVLWDEDGNLTTKGDQKPYVKYFGGKQRIRIYNAQGVQTDRFALTDAEPGDNGGYSIPGNATNLEDGGRKWIVRLMVNDPVYGLRQGHMMVGGKNEEAVFVKGVDVPNINFYVTQRTNNPDVSGTVWVDNPTSGIQGKIDYDGSDRRYTATQAQINLNPSDLFGKTTSNGSGSFTGNYRIANVPPGSYEAVLLPSSIEGYSVRIVPDPINVVANGGDITKVDFLVQKGPATGFRISGGIFIDGGVKGVKEAGEDYVTALGDEITIQDNPPITITDSKEVLGYSRDVPAGVHTVTLSKIRTGFVRSFPPSTSSYTVTAGPGCTGSPAVICDADGNVSAVNFGITLNPTTVPWFQGLGGYMRNDKGSSVTIPAGQYFSIIKDPPLTSPGVIFNFDVNRKSTKGWYAANSPYRPGPIKTSYTYIKDALKKGNANQVNLFGNDAPCGNDALPDCNFNKAGGYYFTTGKSLTLKQADFANGADYVFLIDGNLNIDTGLDVPNGTTVIFAVSGNITVNKNVTRIEGIFSADKIFTVENKTPASETQLVVEGSIIANALRSSADTQFFNNKRDLGSDRNQTTPSVKIIYRPDFVLNAPDLIRYSNYSFHEIPPSGQ